MTTSPGWVPPPWPAPTSPGWGRRTDDLPLRVRLNDVDFHTVFGPEPALGEWICTLRDWDGWLTSAPDDTSTTPHRSGDGVVRGVPRLGPRPVRLEGLVKGSSDWGRGSVADAIATLDRIRWGTLRVEEREGFSREADVNTKWAFDSFSLRVSRYTLTLVADDPLRHSSGDLLLGAGATTIPNRGNVQAWPRIYASGPLTMSIDAPGGRFRLSIPAGAHVVDTRDGVVWSSDGQRVHGAASGPWPYVLPGGSRWTVNDLSATGKIRIDRHEAWS